VFLQEVTATIVEVSDEGICAIAEHSYLLQVVLAAEGLYTIVNVFDDTRMFDADNTILWNPQR